MKSDEIRDLESTELQAQLKEKQEEQFRLRFRAATMEIENPKLFTELRRDVARIKTILHERELAGENS